MRHLGPLGPPAVLIGAALLGRLLAEGTPSSSPTSLVVRAPDIRSPVEGAQSANSAEDLELLYVTDRAKIVDPTTGAFSYGSERSYTMSFGSIDVRAGPDRTAPQET